MQLVKENKQLQKELTEIKKKYPTAYLAYLVNTAIIAEIGFEAVNLPAIDMDAANAMRVHYIDCKRNFDRNMGRATNSEEAGNAIETFINCVFG